MLHEWFSPPDPRRDPACKRILHACPKSVSRHARTRSRPWNASTTRVSSRRCGGRTGVRPTIAPAPCEAGADGDDHAEALHQPAALRAADSRSGPRLCEAQRLMAPMRVPNGKSRLPMNPLLKEIGHNPLLWLLAFVPVVFVTQKLP